MGNKNGYTLICKHCGKEFHHSNTNKMYCSDECKEANKEKGVCPICGSTFVKNTSFQKYCSDKCRFISRDRIGRKRLIENSKKEYIGDEGVNYVECKICGQRMTFFSNAHLKMHNITKEEYEKKYGEIISYPSEFIETYMQGDNNPNSSLNASSQERKERSPFSKEYYIKRNLPEEDRNKFLESVAKNRSYNTRLDYYLNQGLSEEDAKETLAQRQRIGMGGAYSSVSQKMILEVLGDKKDSEKFFYGSKEKRLPYIKNGETKYFMYDLTNDETKRIIEFNGDFWHGNPAKYDINEMNSVRNKTFKEIRKNDEYKYNVAINAGYAVMVIWESEYHKNHDEIIKRCKDFILS